MYCVIFFFFQAEDGIRDVERSRGLGDVYKRQTQSTWVHRIGDYDQFYVSRLHGYGSADNYYRQTSVNMRLHKLKIPTLILAPLDDPIVPLDSLPFEDAQASPHIILATHPCGGHCGFFTGWKPHHWHQIPIIDFLSSVHTLNQYCLLYTSDAADDTPCVDLGGRRIHKKKKKKNMRAQDQQRPTTEELKHTA
eukprot:TRINITY_DN40037_c0_g1_i1.p2 TRINITY_DN40037_c0_g1~~TRINITY_DN40037_c0_g1_i1.p2  ORF type:complete len:193 (-),score=42.22 TRINITY_DN40037_c0_g1_i1:23-601(-)